MRVLVAVACALMTSGMALAASVLPQPTPDASCTFRHPIVEVDSINQVPQNLQNYMLANMDQQAREDAKFEWHIVMAPRGSFFNSTDAIVPGFPSRRFVRAGHMGQEWFVWYETGGIAYFKNMLLAHVPYRGPPRVRAFLSWRNEDPCAVTDALLDFRPAPASLGQGWW